jgi:hypothetical protein
MLQASARGSGQNWSAITAWDQRLIHFTRRRRKGDQSELPLLVVVVDARRGLLVTQKLPRPPASSVVLHRSCRPALLAPPYPSSPP